MWKEFKFCFQNQKISGSTFFCREVYLAKRKIANENFRWNFPEINFWFISFLLFSLKKFKFFITWKSTNVFTAKNAQKYEKDVAMELPMPRYSRGKSSPISNQEIGEIPAKIIKLIRTRIQ